MLRARWKILDPIPMELPILKLAYILYMRLILAPLNAKSVLTSILPLALVNHLVRLLLLNVLHFINAVLRVEVYILVRIISIQYVYAG